MKGAPAGNLFVQVEIEPHQFFTREGTDIHVTVPISFKMVLPHPTPYSLHLHPTPYALKPKPLNPKPYTARPRPHIRWCRGTWQV